MTDMDRKFFKTEAVFQNYSKMHPFAQEVCAFMIQTALDEGVKDPMVTETKTTTEIDKALGRVSESHSDGRAWDFRTWNMTEEQRNSIMSKVNYKYGQYGAFNKIGARQLLVYHDSGHGAHLHCQLDRSFSVKK